MTRDPMTKPMDQGPKPTPRDLPSPAIAGYAKAGAAASTLRSGSAAAAEDGSAAKAGSRIAEWLGGGRRSYRPQLACRRPVGAKNGSYKVCPPCQPRNAFLVAVQSPILPAPGGPKSKIENAFPQLPQLPSHPVTQSLCCPVIVVSLVIGSLVIGHCPPLPPAANLAFSI